MRLERELLGRGGEGVVHREGDTVVKRFATGKPSDEQVAWLQRVLPGLGAHLPVGTFRKAEGRWELRYPYEPTEPVTSLPREPLERFLRFLARESVVCLNLKLENFRWRNGELYFVDIGEWVLPFHLPFFVDLCARAFILMNGATDTELAARTASLREPGAFDALAGFSDFYREVVLGEARRFLSTTPPAAQSPARALDADDVTLLIKACAMDAEDITEQVCHIVGQLGRPRRVAEVLVAVDPYEGPFLRQYRHGDLPRLLRELDALRAAGIVDRVLVAPTDADEVAALNRRWFGVECRQTHTGLGVPVHPQLWAFEQVRTRYVLQCDSDVLVGRRDPQHDFLSEMKAAAVQEDVLGVAFNIPFPEGTVNPYGAAPGRFVPEVRCGLLYLERIAASRPFPNAVLDGRLTQSWYRSVEQAQVERGLRFVRGGDARSYYVHPANTAKRRPGFVDRVRDLVEANTLPSEQHGRWDVVEDETLWRYAMRTEDVVFLVMGRECPLDKVERCVRSLLGQRHQEFGVLFVDDGSAAHHARAVRERASALGTRLTFIHHRQRHGRLANKWEYVRGLIPRPETLICVLDMDDYLMNADAAATLASVQADGVDIAVGGSFRADKPTKAYPVDFASAARHRGAGNVWVHLRCFTRRAFDTLTLGDLQDGSGAWFDSCSDYVTMVPMVMRTRRRAIVGGLLHVHERSTPRSDELRHRRNGIIDEVLRRNR